MSNRDASALVPGIRQQSQFSCMEASISAALQALEKPYTEEDVHRILGAEPLRGASWEQALSCCQYFGLRGTLVVPSTIAQLKAWTDAGIPVIIAWTPRDRPWAHASVVYNVDDTHVHVMDPNLPDPNQTSIVLTHEEFYSKWFEKFSDTVIVRRPAMAVEREVTVDGRQVMAGKKELRSMKDRGMSRHLKHGPVRPVDRGDTQSAMSKAQWEIRKEEGRAGLPGAGMGAGAHKDKSMYNRGEGKGVDREATDEAGDNDKSAVLFQGLMQKFLKDKKSPKEAPTHGKKTPDPFYDVLPSWEKVRRPKTSQQPLMTRRDYGVTAMLLNTKDFECALRGKTAVNLPADVERYVKEVAEGNPDYTDEQVWATAWSIFCRANPDSEHCHQESYLKAAALNKTAGYSHYWEVKTEIDPAVWAKIVAAAKKIVAAAEAQGIAVRGPMGTGKPEFTDEDIALNGDKSTRNDYESFVLIRKPDGFSFVKTDKKPYDAVVVSILAVVKKLVKDLSVRSDGGPGAIRKVLAKFPRGESMTVDEVAKVVGPEFKEMNEDPPESVVKVMEGMQGKTAGDDNSEGLQKAIKATKKMLTDLLDMKLPKNIEDPLRKAIETNLKSYESQMKASKTAHRPSLLAMDAFAEMLRDGKFEEGVPADPTKNMSPRDAAEWKRQTEEHEDEFKIADLESVLHRDDENNAIVEQFFNRTAAPKLVWKVNRVMGAQYAETPVGTYWIHPEGRHYEVKLDQSPVGYANQDQYAEDPSAEAKKMVGAHYAKALRGKTAAVTAGGKYGFTKGTESACGVGVNKLQKSASRIAKALYAKDEGSPAFLAKHAARAGSKTASMLLKAMESIGPMAALAKNGKTAGKSGTGLYGFSENSAKLGLDACTALHHEAGMIAGDLFARKGSDPMKVAGYLAVNAKKGKCAYSAMLGECSPDVAVEVTGSVKKKAAGGFDTNYIGGGSYSISAPKAWLEKLIAAFPKSFPRPRMMPNPNGPNDSLFTKNEKVVRAAEKWFSENGLQMTKKASDFLASVDDDEIDGNEEVLDLISKCGR